MSAPAGTEARFQTASDQSLLVYFGDRITPEAHQQVVKLLRMLEVQPIAGVRNLHPAYTSLLIDFDALVLRQDQLELLLREDLSHLEEVVLPQARLVEIPVCYGGDFGPDLADVAASHGITAEQVIELHAAGSYEVFFLGFAPGFAYLAGLPKALSTPRLAVPRKKVPRGSVGIAGNQTAVYPLETPGGWRLIGRTPLAMFRPDGWVRAYLGGAIRGHRRSMSENA
jgi:KipI family sensor histidine kinase inhibitor